MLVLMVAVTTLGLTLESRGGPVERAVLGFPFGIFQPAQVWDSLPSVWVGWTGGWATSREDTLVLFEEASRDSFPLQEVRIPFSFRVQAPTQANFLGGVWTTRWGRLAWAVGAPMGNRVVLRGRSMQEVGVDWVVRDTLTQEHLPDLRPEDRIPVEVHLSGTLGVAVEGEGGMEETRAPIMLSWSRAYPRWGWGVGVLLDQMRLRGDGGGTIGVDLQTEITAQATVDPASGWVVEGGFAGSFVDPSLVELDLTGSVEALRAGLGVGVWRAWRWWVFRGMVDAGVWYLFPTRARGRVVMSARFPTGEPDTVRWNWENVEVDTQAQVIRGRARVDVEGLGDTVVVLMEEEGVAEIPGNWMGRLGLEIGVRWVQFGLEVAGGTGASGEERYQVQVSLAAQPWIPLRLLGGVYAARTPLGENASVGWLPLGYVGLVGEMRLRSVGLRMGVMYQSSQVGLQILGGEGVGQPLILLALGYRWGNPGAAP